LYAFSEWCNNRIGVYVYRMRSLVTSPFKFYLEVFFLLQNKHMMVEELLQFLIAEVDAQLLEPVELKMNII
jgi:hypothetical protein